MRAKPVKRAVVAVRFVGSRAAALGGGPVANDNAPSAGRLVPPCGAVAAGIERLIAGAARGKPRAGADRSGAAPGEAFAEADGRRA